jgi:hypothetical protein
METKLREVLSAIERREWVYPSAGHWHLSLISVKQFDAVFFSDAIPRFIAAVNAELGIRLSLVGGGPGCAEFEFAIEHDDPDELARLLVTVLESPKFQQLALNATLVRMQLRVIPNTIKKDLSTGVIDNPGRQTITGRSIFMLGGSTMGDQYINEGQASNVGPHGTVTNASQIWQAASATAGGIDLKALQIELGKLRASLKAEASQPEHDEAIGAIASAETAAKQGDQSKIVESLAKAGKWALDVAEKIGVGLVVAILKTTLGL